MARTYLSADFARGQDLPAKCTDEEHAKETRYKTGACRQCHRDGNRRSYIKHHDSALATRQKYRDAHPDMNRDWSKKNAPPGSARRSWYSMKLRCHTPSHPDFKYYGGKGVKVCDRWLESFDNFLEDMGERPPGKTLDRIDSALDYTPDNCRWATSMEQCHNRSNSKCRSVSL